MIINFVKLIHLILTLSLLAGLFISFKLFLTKASNTTLIRTNRILLYISLFAMLTGTLLIYPKHFTLHTPWIQAAYLLLSLFIGCIVIFNIRLKQPSLSFIEKFSWVSVYSGLLLILILVVHDAVMKSTFLF